MQSSKPTGSRLIFSGQGGSRRTSSLALGSSARPALGKLGPPPPPEERKKCSGLKKKNSRSVKPVFSVQGPKASSRPGPTVQSILPPEIIGWDFYGPGAWKVVTLAKRCKTLNAERYEETLEEYKKLNTSERFNTPLDALLKKAIREEEAKQPEAVRKRQEQENKYLAQAVFEVMADTLIKEELDPFWSELINPLLIEIDKINVRLGILADLLPKCLAIISGNIIFVKPFF